MIIRKADRKDAWGIMALALLLWPDHETDSLFREMTGLLENPEAGVFVAVEEKTMAGFAQCALRRDYVEGTSSSPVGYLEGIYVREAYRRQGVAAALVSACEDWARARNCIEFASDCALDNQPSIRFHLGAGFYETNRIVCFVKKL